MQRMITKRSLIFLLTSQHVSLHSHHHALGVGLFLPVDPNVRYSVIAGGYITASKKCESESQYNNFFHLFFLCFLTNFR